MQEPVSESHMIWLLRLTGAATLGAALLFLAPTLTLSLIGMAVGDNTGLFFVRHWGLLVGCIGALMIYSAAQPPLRVPVLLVATVEKLVFVLMVVLHAGDPALAGLRLAAAFDGLCVLLFMAALWRQLGHKVPG